MSCAGQFEASTTPWVNLRHLMSHVPGGGEFKPCLTGLRNKNRKCQVSPAKHTFFRCLKVKSSLLRANGSEQKVQVLKLGERIESRSLILPLRKKLTLKSRVWGIWRQLWPGGGGGWTNKSSKVQMPGGLPGEILKLRIDRRIDQGNPLQCNLENLVKIFNEFYHRINYYKLLSWCKDISCLFISHCWAPGILQIVAKVSRLKN